MTIALRQLNNTGSPLTDVGGNVLANTQVTFTLVDAQGNPTDTFDSVDFSRICGSTSTTTASDGTFSVYLWPNDRGTTNTMYKCTVANATVAPVMGILTAAISITSWYLFKTTTPSYTPAQSTALTVEIARAEAAEAVLQANIDGEAAIRAAHDLTAGINGGTIDNTVIGGTTPAAGHFTSLNAATPPNSAAFSGSGAGTGYQYISLANTSGNAVFGVESSVAAQLMLGSSAYDTVLGSGTGVTIRAGTGIARLSSTGLAVTGAISASGAATLGTTSVSTLSVGSNSAGLYGGNIIYTGTTVYAGLYANAATQSGLGNTVVSWNNTGTATRLNATTGGIAGLSINNVDILVANSAGIAVTGAISATGAATLGATSVSTLGLTGLTTVTNTAATSSKFLSVNGSTTANTYGQLQNSGGSALFGLENSVGGSLNTGSAAYSTVITTGNTTNLSFGVNQSETLRITANGIQFTLNGSTSVGAIVKSATAGLAMQGVAGSINDFTLFSAAGNAILANPTGTTNLNANGNFAVTGTLSTTGGIDNLKSATTVVNVSSATAPTSGQVLTATSGTAANWQTPVSLNAVQSWTKGQISTPYALSIVSNNVNIDFSQSNNFTLVLQATTTQQLTNSFTNGNAGQSGQIVITQNGSTASLLSFGSYWKSIDGSTQTVSTTLSAQNLITYYIADSTHIWFNISKNGVA